MTIDARQPMRPPARRDIVKGIIAGYRGTCDYRKAASRSWEFRMGWLDGRRFRGALTPYGLRCWLNDVGWFGQRWRDRRPA